MYVDVSKYSGVDLSQTSAILYLKLNVTTTPIAGFQQFAKPGAAPFGGVVTQHKALREQFVATYGGSLAGPTYRWNNCQFVQTADSSWVIRLQQDQNLMAQDWYRGTGHTTTFGTGGGQFDLTTTLIDYILVRQHTLCNQDDVERALLSEQMGRLKFAEQVSTNSTGEHIMAYDDLWQIIYRQSAIFQGAFSKRYQTPLLLSDEGARLGVADVVAKSVVLELFRMNTPYANVFANTQLLTEWKSYVDEYLDSPPDLEGEPSATGQGAGTYQLVRA